MNFTFALISMLGFVVAGMVAAFGLASNPSGKLNRVFFLFASAVAFFCLFDAMSMMTAYAGRAAFFDNFSVICWQIFLVLLMYFILGLAGREDSLVGYFLMVAAGVTAYLFAYLSWTTDFFYLPPVMGPWGFVIRPGPLFGYFALHSVIIVAVEVYLLFRVLFRRQQPKRMKRQAALILIGLSLGALIGLVFDVCLPFLGVYEQSVVPLATTIFIFFLAYAFIKYGSFSITPAFLAPEILDTMPGFLIVVDLTRKIVMANKGLLNALGYEEKELRGKVFAELMGQQLDCDALEAQVDRGGQVRDRQTSLIRKDGQKVPVMMDATLVADQIGDKVGCVLIFRDISREVGLLEEQGQTIAELTRTKERMLSILEDMTEARDLAKRSAADLAKALDDLKLVDKMKTEFLSVISHELRTPITPIKGYSSMMISGQLGAMSKGQKRAAEIIKKESDHLMVLIDSVLDVARMSHGRSLELNKEPIQIKTIIDDLKDVLEPEWQARKIDLSLDLPEDFPALMADSTKIKRLFANLLGNAFKFTPKGGKVSISGKAVDDSVVLYVADDGIGIDKDNIEKVFEKFYQVDSSYTRAAGGVGLGLAVAKEIVEAHGGRMWVESEGLGKGSKFCFNLPIS